MTVLLVKNAIWMLVTKCFGSFPAFTCGTPQIFVFLIKSVTKLCKLTVERKWAIMVLLQVLMNRGQCTIHNVNEGGAYRKLRLVQEINVLMKYIGRFFTYLRFCKEDGQLSLISYFGTVSSETRNFRPPVHRHWFKIYCFQHIFKKCYIINCNWDDRKYFQRN